MAKFKRKYEGGIYELEAPEGTSEEDLQEALFQHLSDERGVGEDILRKAEFGSRGVVDAVAEAAGFLPELASSGLRLANIPAPSAGYYPETIKKGLSYIPEKLGLSVPQLAPSAMLGPMSTADKIAYGAGKGAGSAASVFLPAGAIGNLAKARSTTANVAQELAKQKALQTAAGVTGGVVTETTDSPLLGAAASMAVPFAALVPSVAKNATMVALQRQGLKSDAPTTEVLKAIKSEAYKAVDETKGEIKPSALQRFKINMKREIEEAGYDADLNPVSGPSNVLKTITKMIKNKRSLNLTRIEQIRKNIGIAIDNATTNLGDKNIAMKMRNSFDDWIDSLKSNDITVDGKPIFGDVVENTAAIALKNARNANAKYRKSEAIEEIVTNAEMQASGFENGLRIGFRQLLKSKKRIKGFTEDERKIMREIVDGNVGTNLARLVGRFGLQTTGGSPNIVGASIGGAAGYQYDPLGAIAVPAVGTGSKVMADRLARNTADYLRAMAATGGRDVAPRSRVTPRAGLLGAVALQNLNRPEGQ